MEEIFTPLYSPYRGPPALSKTTSPLQIIDDPTACCSDHYITTRYIRIYSLLKLLEEVYEKENFRVEVEELEGCMVGEGVGGCRGGSVGVVRWRFVVFVRQGLRKGGLSEVSISAR